MLNKLCTFFKEPCIKNTIDPLIGDAKEGDFIIIQIGKHQFKVCEVYYSLTKKKLDYSSITCLTTLEDARLEIKAREDYRDSQLEQIKYIKENSLPKRVY